MNNGARLDILTSMKGIDISFDECYTMARKAMVSKVEVPVLHINHLIANKKIVAHPKDLLDVIQLEKIQKLREEENL